MSKRIMSFFVIVTMALGLFAGCGSAQTTQSPVEDAVTQEESVAPAQDEVEPDDASAESSEKSQSPELESSTNGTEPIQVGAMMGPTAMGMVKLMEDSQQGLTQNNYNFTLGNIDQMVANLAKGDFDIAAVPANLASVLYHNTEGNIQVLAINTLGVLYVVDQSGTVATIEDLKGKTLYSTGKGATPEYALNYVLEQNDISPSEDLNIEFKSEAAEIIPLLANNPTALALLPQPFVTVAQQKVPELSVALDWTKEWEAVSEGKSSLLTGVIVVQREFAENHPDLLEVFAREYQASTAYANSNVLEAAELVEKFGIVDAVIAEKALPAANITYLSGDRMKNALEGYLSVLFEQDPTSTGGSLPDENFYLTDISAD